MKRSKHSLSNYKLLTCDMGKLVPVSCTEVLPGDSLQQSSSALVRVSPLLAPVMHPVQVRFHHWFVPTRLLWDGFEDFITGGPDGTGGDSGPIPVINSGPSGFAAHDLLDYMGVPPLVPDIEVSAFQARAYNLIFNEYYRDQDLIAEVPEDSLVVQNCAWEKDYFSAARPWPQKGPDITLPLGTQAPIRTDAVPSQNVAVQDLNGVSRTLTVPTAASPLILTTSGTGNPLFADLTEASAVNVNDVRLAFALQRYSEARARYGSRYTEYLRYLGVRSSDARLQRPEYLGGGKQTISFSEVLQTGPDAEGSGVADLRGHGISAMRTRRFRRFFEEHGYVLTLMSVRPRTMYTDGLHRSWSRRTKEDYWQRELEHIGQQEVYNREVFARSDATGGDGVFGFNDRYAEYRSLPSSIAGDFRDTLDYWHLARMFTSAPVLNQSFVTCTPSKRINAEQTTDNLWIMVNNSIQARRLVSNNASGRIY